MNDKFSFILPTFNNGDMKISVTVGDVFFVLGANGAGKSSIMHRIYTQNSQSAKRISAHRQTWISDNASTMTASVKKRTETDMKSNDMLIKSRFMDAYGNNRTLISVIDLINSENDRARSITNAVDDNKIDVAKDLSLKESPVRAINDILKQSNIPIEISIGTNEQIFASKQGSELYSISELSDGERNALLIATDVLTVKPNSLIILDEPERHLHRSIISPLLNTLFSKRKDCAFIISSHDINLPMDNPKSDVLLVRSCHWAGKNPIKWIADLISSQDEIPELIKKDILGAKNKLLFIEGDSTSLDLQLYPLLYPAITVLPQGSCTQVERAVDGIKATEKVHWIKAYGLVDADDRTEKQIEKLLQKGIVALPFYSVEALYYNLFIIKKVATILANTKGSDDEELFNTATGKIIEDISQHKQRLCAMLCEKKLRDKVMSSLPSHNDIISADSYNFTIDLKTELEKEIAFFDELISENNIQGLIARYPIRMTQTITNILKRLGIAREWYESIVRKQVSSNEEVRDYYKGLLQPLTNLID